jgi:hypothetical protein
LFFDHLLTDVLFFLEALSLTVLFKLGDVLLLLGILILHTFMLLLLATYLVLIGFKVFIGTVEIITGTCLLGPSL